MHDSKLVTIYFLKTLLVTYKSKNKFINNIKYKSHKLT